MVGPVLKPIWSMPECLKTSTGYISSEACFAPPGIYAPLSGSKWPHFHCLLPGYHVIVRSSSIAGPWVVGENGFYQRGEQFQDICAAILAFKITQNVRAQHDGRDSQRICISKLFFDHSELWTRIQNILAAAFPYYSKRPSEQWTTEIGSE